MAKSVSDFIVDRLSEWGVERIFGYPGDGINGILGALNRAEEKLKFIQVRHEESAAFMATAHAKFTGMAGVCLATSGPGAIHLLNGLYDAKLDHQPVVAIVGQQARMALGSDYQQEVDLQSLFKDVAGAYVQTAMDASQIRHLIDRAFRIALSRRTVTCIIIPNDLQEMKFEEPERNHYYVHSSVGYNRPRLVPEQEDILRAAEILNRGEKVAILAGAGAFNAGPELIEVAELLGGGIAKALLGKAVLPDDLPFVTGPIGLLGSKPSWDMMNDCDTLLMIGSGFPYTEFLPKEGQARGVQIDIDGGMLGIRYPMDVHLQGDSRETLRLLIPHLKRKEDRSWRESIEKGVEKWWKVLESRSDNEVKNVNPQKLFWELSKKIPDDSILCADSGTVVVWYARDLKIREGMMASLSGNLASMCPAIPYAIAAKFAYPDRMPIAMLGDGAMQMLGINEMITVGKYCSEWTDQRFMVVVLNNRDLNMVTWEQRALAGDPKFEASQDLPDFPYAAYARMLGWEGIEVKETEELGPALEKAFAAGRPVLLEVYTDPSAPVLPPHISFEQMKSFTSAIVQGDKNAAEIIKNTWKEMVDTVFPKEA